ncbi:MAG: bifunctional folylpolyglutamate synthase/dihydrofolate synthase [Deltaproteobacteria bacterium]|nr:MAG: bifunctional folylpolyglutamate synthase/dihydrofolate synthase [Deltaproteobacteria bacterium]
MTYAELLARLLPARRFGVVLGLDRVRALLDRLGAPDRRLGAIVHVGGTNGKGSTVAMIAALAAAAGQRVASFTSPHLSCLRERIVIDGAMIGEAEIVAAAERVAGAGGDELTFFEQITAIAVLAIAGAGVDVTVLEVGLGGRLDATNVVDPAVAVVTGVALDHQAILGDTIARIAGEKAGIWKPGRPAIIGASGVAEAVPLLVEAARAAGAEPRIVDAAAVAAVPALGLAGEHQRRNAAAAIAAVRALGLPIVASALASVKHPGRFEVIDPTGVPGVPRIILDGAHNPHGAAALAETLRASGERPALIAAVSADKDVAAIAAALAPVVRAVVATRYRQDRAMPPPELAAVFAAAAGAPIVIAGSLFLVGEARTLLLGAPTDPMLVTDPAGPPAPGESSR